MVIAEHTERYINRELSWLDFNARVLELASDPALPLLERVKFCSIVSSNLDEFFMVRVGGLQRQATGGVARSMDGRSPRETLAEIRERTLAIVDAQARLWKAELVPALAAKGVAIVGADELDDAGLAALAEHYDRRVHPVLTPLAVGPGQPFPYISGLSVSLGVFVIDPESGEERFARVKVPEGMDRFAPVGDGSTLVPLEDVIEHFMSRLFPGMEVRESACFRVTRNADYEVSDEADDLLEAIELELRRRRFGEVVRVEVDARMSERMATRLQEWLPAAADQVYRIPSRIDLADLSQLGSLERPDLQYEPWVPVPPPRLVGDDGGAALFAELRACDMLVHLPYESFGASVETFVKTAARDPDVVALKTTVYRTSDESPLVPALVRAAEEAKQSVCLVELKARFDERRNIEWSRALEQAGCHVSYGFPNMKIHAKTTLVVRQEGDLLRRYVHIGTGNYHAVTARLYEDFGLFTDDEDITADVADLFNFLTGFGRPGEFRKLLVAPFGLREGLIERIRAVAGCVAAGKPGRIRIKVNALTDPALIDELYLASEAGVRIEILARGICSLRPGVPGLSENIVVRSVLGRFLEHSRVFAFDANGYCTYLMGSADLMPRNLDHRVEVVVLVEDAAARRRLDETLDLVLADRDGAWELRPDGGWERVEPAGEDGEPAQTELMRRARRRLQAARRRAAAGTG